MQSEIVIVSGIPRSGTSLMMQMLKAGGVSVVTDEQRLPDSHNPKGYCEFERIKSLEDDSSILEGCRGRAVKIVSGLLKHLPSSENYRVVFMHRDLGEVVASQGAMMAATKSDNRGKTSEIIATLERHIHYARYEQLPSLSAAVLDVWHSAVMASPAGVAAQVAMFLNRELDVDAMARCVEPELYRQRQSVAIRL